MDKTWILHEHSYEPCGCGVIASIYNDIPGDRYANGTDHVTVLRCAEHPSTGHKVDHIENAQPEEDLDWEDWRGKSWRWFGWFR